MIIKQCLMSKVGLEQLLNLHDIMMLIFILALMKLISEVRRH